jgi:hypothetical protein
MSEAAAIQGDYVDLRFVKSRKVAQVILEIPIETAARFVEAFGTPNPATGVPVALARLNTEKQEREPKGEPVNSPNPPKGGKMCQKAGILCKEGAFQKWSGCDSEIDTANFIRTYCGILSRTELDENENAARRFRQLVADYNAWRSLPA